MAACKSDKINNVKQAIQLAGKQPVIIDVDAFALQNCYEINYQPKAGEVVALLNIGAATMNINILNGTRSVFARDASVGGSQYTSLLQKELGLSFEQAEGVKRGAPLPEGIEPRPIQPIIEAVSDTLALEVRKTMDFYRATAEQDSDGGIQKILLAGGGSKLPGLAEYLAKRFEIPVEVFDPFRQIEVDANKFDPDYMVRRKQQQPAERYGETGLHAIGSSSAHRETRYLAKRRRRCTVGVCETAGTPGVEAHEDCQSN